jgi:thioredoxin 1|tara:strand:+ start:491 stop:715 length:225 start_codon:yes stop_codon:yes gene_type:complete
MYGQVLDKITPEYNSKIDFYKVDVEESQDLAMAFNARSLPTTIMISKSGKGESILGAQPEDTLKYYLEGLISKK